MAQPSSRAELKEYCLKQLGKPVLEINVDDDQIDNLMDDAIQYFHEHHFDGIDRVYLKHQLTPANKTTLTQAGVSTTTSATVPGDGLTSIDYVEGVNYLPLPDSIIGVNKVIKINQNTISAGLFNIKYQLFLNDVYHWGSLDLLSYAMTKSYLSDIDFLLTTQKQIRFNKRQGRLYLDVDYNQLSAGNYLIIDCDRLMNPTDYSLVWNDNFLKQYATSLIKRQWGQNLIKFQGVKLPGGLEFNGRTLYEDAQREIDTLMDKMSSTYELPPLDMIG